LFNHLYGYALLQNRRAEQARPYLEKAVRAGGTADYFYIDYADFYLAQAAFRLGRWAEAEQHYQRYLRRHRGPALKALATLELGQSLDMQGRRNDAVAVYRRVKATRSYDSDQSAFGEAQRLIAAPMTPAEQTVLKGRNAYLAGQYKQGATWLTSIKDDATVDAAIRMEATYHLGRLHQARGQTEQALASFKHVAQDASGHSESRWIPWSRYFIGEIYAGKGEKQRARQSFEEALEYDGDYDYRQSLEQQAKAALARL
jgi:predicted negative regulator of RcsB-dependent stress response